MRCKSADPQHAHLHKAAAALCSQSSCVCRPYLDSPWTIMKVKVISKESTYRVASCPGRMSSKAKKKTRRSFGATAPPFIDYLKDILRRYPDGGQILKELIQNADDAQATKVVFIHDERGYGTESLWTDELGEYQGPALYAYNNAAFTDDDWEGIQKAGRSVKRNDPNRVGRFGIGFNSVYHITDVPSIFSSEYLGFMDPQEKIFGERDGGFRWSLDDAEDRDTLMTMHDQFQPFRDIVSLVSGQEWSKVIMEDQEFDGTIFRFPLRHTASEISDNLYDSDKVVELFDSFIADAGLSLLFLKNVTSVSLMHINAYGTVSTRLEVKSSVSTDFVQKSEDGSICEGSTMFKSITLNSEDHKETKWLITTSTMKEGNLANLDALAKKLSFYPRVDLAFPCSEKRDCSESRLSCFLPLPNNESNKTGLPVYVNACFGLTDNRRHIKWQEEDQKHDEHALWNELLMKEVLPQAYLMMIQHSIKLAQESALSVSAVYDLWPDIARIKHKDKWYTVALDVLHHLFRQNVAVLSLAKDERKFVTPSEAVFPCNGPTSPDILAAIKTTLVSCGENLVTLPGSVARAINEAYPHTNTLKRVTPTLLRDVLRRIDMCIISKEDKLHLLEYVLSDEKYGELRGLQLLPLTDGSFRSFTDREEDTALMDSKEFTRVLLPCCQHLFISDDLSPECSAHLKKLARRNLFKVINIDADHVAEYMRRYLPQDWKQMKTRLVTWDVSSCQHPPLDWLQEFWKFLNTHFKELSNFTGLPLIPVSPLSVSQPVSLARLQQNTTLICQKSKQMNLPEQIAQLVNKVGGTVVRGNEWLRHEDLDSYVLCPSPGSVMKVLMNLNSQNLIKELKTISQGAREELKDYLSRLDSLSVSEKALLSELPLFQTMKGSCVGAQSKQAVLLISGLTIPAEFPMPDSVVQCATEADRRLLQLLKVELLETADAAYLLIDCIAKRTCTKEDTEKIMTWILQHDEIRHSKYENIVGDVMPLMGELSNRVSSQLGLNNQPPPEKVIENLFILKSKAQTMADPDTDGDFKKKLRGIYEHMQDHISEFAKIMNKDTPWLWSHNQFVSPQDLVLDYPRNLDLSSYIGKVPDEFLPYKRLLQKFGLRTSLSDEEIVGILHSIQQTIEERQQPFANSSEIKVSIEILNWLWRERKTIQEDIPVPVLIEGEQYTLKPLSTAVFCDVSKNGLEELQYSQEEIHVVHEEIPKATAEWLNIQFLSTHILDPELVGIEQCGQSEPITTRIKNILKEYDEESDIFKELIQNAEDAGARCLGNGLLILDPNVTHLTKHIKHNTNPGIKLDLSKQRHFKCFPGQFGPFERIFDCNFTRQSSPEPYPGTLIKLPFRTEEEARKSEISTKVYNKHNIITFQQHLTENSQTHLLFLKNINTLSLQSISNDASTPPRDDEIETILTVSKTTVSTMRIPDDTNVAKQHQAQKSLMKLDVKCKEVIDCCTVNIVQITSQQSGEVQSWLLYNCFGTHQSLKMALQENKEAKFSLPIGGVALPLQNDPDTGKLASLQTNLVGQAFCFLPLSIHTGLPVNVNGTFAVTSNRKGLWESGVKHDWNKALLQDPVVTAYITALSVLKKMSENNQLETYCYHSFWPDREKVSETFKPLVDAFYHAIAQQSIGPELFSDGEHWCSMNNAIFLHWSIKEDKNIHKLVVEVCKKYVKAPVVPLPLWLRNSFKQAGLERVLQSRTWTWEMFYQEAVFNNLDTMDPKTRDTLVMHAIDLNIKEIDNLLVCHPCIPTTGGQLQYIKKLVNPSGKVACLFEPVEGRLLDGTKNDFCSPKRIQRLLELGMANDHLPWEDITEKAGTITKTWCTDKRKAYGHLKCLLELMKNHMYDKDSLHWETLRMTEFLPSFSPGDTKMERNATLRRPTDIFSDKCSLLVNLTEPVLDHTNLKIHHTDPVLHILGVHDSPMPEGVFQQLEEACEQSQSIDRPMLHKIAYECYKFLNQWLSDNEDSTFISQRANSFPFILVGNTFVNVDRVAENEQFEAKPYLYVLPPAFTCFRELWESVGVQKQFAISQFLTVLQELHSQHGNKPLPKSDLSICLTILNKGIFEAKEKTSDCLIPNKDGVLQPASEMFYNDSPWMPEVAAGVTLCHENIPRVMARYFGIKTTRHHTLQNHVVENISPFAFQFEQQEQLTVRIKNIISAYPAKKDILKELIQNADDAEATEIHFVWDKRQHGKEKTFGKKWNQLQGPALCVFNNKVFSDADLAGIQQLGEGGKHSSPGKVGKYGVGFNSVYHLTDCPSILTGDTLLCISDPNKKYIESHSDKSPAGIGYNLDDTIKSMYQDVYTSYLPEKFPLREGTMFRLPLRMGTMANSSKISQQGVTDQDMKELCSALSEDPEGLILFLKNICKIEVHEINDHSGKLETVFMVEKTIPQTSREGRDAFVKLQQNALRSDGTVEPHKAIYGTKISTSDKRQSKWIIAEQFGSFKNSGEITVSDKLPQGAIAACLSSKTWRNSDLAPPSHVKFTGEAFCTLPLPGKTGLPVHVNANFEVDSARRSLWKEDGQSLKSDWNDSLKQDVIAPLYADLLHYISCNIGDKKVSASHIESFLSSSYLCFWPSVSRGVGQDWHEMIHEVYRSIKERGLNVIPVLRSSARLIAGRNVKEYSFAWCNVRETDATKAPYLTQSATDEIYPILEDLGMTLVPISSEMLKVWKNFTSAGIKVKDVNPSTVQTFLREKPLNDPSQTDKGLPLPITATLIRDDTRCATLLKFCLKDFSVKKVTEENSNLLNGLPLLLTRDKVLRVFNSKSPKLISGYERLFFGNEDKFADYQTNREVAHVLQTFNLLKSLTVSCAAPYLKPLIEQLLQKCEVDPHSGLHTPSEEMMHWLKPLWKFLTSQITTSSGAGVKLSDVKQLFNDSCILPVVCPSLNNKLCLLQKMKDMPSVIQFALERDISGILFKLGFMKLDSVFFSDVYVDRQERLLLHPELMDVDDKSSVLDQVYNIKHTKFSQLSTDEMKELQCFLQSGVSKSKDKQDYQRKLKSLPLFETIHGKRMRIDGPKEVFILNSTYSKAFPDLFILSDSNSICLQYNPENCTLSETLNIQILTDLEFFMKFILPAVHKLTAIQMLHCLKLLLHLNYFQHKDKIISSLKTVKMIPNSQGRLETASYYFDEGVQLYKKMLPQERFVPKTFWTELCDGNAVTIGGPRQLLKDLGMKHEVSKDDIINFANQLESEARGNSQLEELKQKSSLLLREALTLVNEKKDEKLLESIADIKFIFPVKIRKELTSYHQPFAAERTAVKIRGSLMESDPKHQDLIWSAMPIIHLSVYKSQKLLQMMKKVGAHEQPPPDCVTRNMSNICLSPCETDQLIKTRANVFRSSYAYLQANSFQGQPLAGHPVVLAEKDTKLVRADDVALSLPEYRDFRPYLYRISPQDVMFAEFFKKIGVKDTPTAVQYCNVLAAVYADSCDKPQLNPNQQKTVKRAVGQFFKLIKTQKPALVDDVKALYLPAVDGKLHSSCTLHYNDTVFEIKRLEEALKNKFLLLEKLSECDLGSDIYEHNQLLQLLPQKFQPKMLSQFTEEKVVEEQMQLCELETDCEFSGWFEKHLSSRAFTHGLICLIREQSKGEISQNDATDMCKMTFGSIQIICCKSLKTMLWLDKQPLHKTATVTDVFVKREQQGCIFYLKHNDGMLLKVVSDIIMTLTKEINALLGNRIASCHLPVLGQLLTCDTLQEVQKTLAKNAIRDSAETESLHFNPPAPGTEIPEEWHDSLDMNILNNFEEGEYVGYSTNDKYIYAVIVEELLNGIPSGQYSQRYKIDIGEDEPVEVSCLDLYQFKREKKLKPEGSTCTSAEASCKELVLLPGAAPHSSKPSTTSPSFTRSSPASIDEAKREIDRCLEEIWTLPAEERHKAIKRLYLRWHPDKNPDCQHLATEAFKYLQNQIDELSKGRGKSKTTGPSSPSRNSNFRDFYQQWNQEARHHRAGRERFSRSNNFYNFWTHNENVPKPDREEAQRWCRQARCDLSAAHKDTDGGSREWCLFKVHQAVEKSLIAAEYKKHGKHPANSSITAMASRVSLYNLQLRVLPQIVENLKMLGVDAKKTQAARYLLTEATLTPGW
ncbi:hypothetical protein L3Q82_004335 [Scortum barcoo]|uniref:Uncharacterized protein n=1 Tax=Scortum barcoo TaxID=214431 RepID=A0ACB8VML8_9TELE|nr:hypothetical protein L3Q82_004335 [Scortum barcoo]